MNLAVIPARGGSKRIPGKNIRAFAGKPMIGYSIEAALTSGVFDRVWVSTDNQEIAELALQYGAEVPFMRPASLSDDHTGTRAVTNHAINYAHKLLGQCDYCCCIYATAPFIQAEYLKKGLAMLESQPEKAFALSVTSFPFPVQRAIKISQEGIQPMFEGMMGMRSQDLDEAFHDAGQFYWGRAKDYLSDKGIFSHHSIPVVLPRYLVQDIDTVEDWQRAELMYKAYMTGDSHA